MDPLLDTADDVLRVMTEQHPYTSVMAQIARELRASEDRVDAERYQPARALELKAAARRKATASMADELRRDDAEAERDGERRLARFDAELRRRPTVDASSVDLARLDGSTSPAEVKLVVEAAIRTGDADLARRAWTRAEQRLRTLALSDQRQYRIGGSGSAFHVLTTLGAAMKNLARAHPDRGALAEQLRRERGERRQHLLAVADVVGLRADVEAAARRAVLEPPAGAGGMVIGRFFDDVEAARRRK